MLNTIHNTPHNNATIELNKVKPEEAKKDNNNNTLALLKEKLGISVKGNHQDLVKINDFLKTIISETSDKKGMKISGFKFEDLSKDIQASPDYKHSKALFDKILLKD